MLCFLPGFLVFLQVTTSALRIPLQRSTVQCVRYEYIKPLLFEACAARVYFSFRCDLEVQKPDKQNTNAYIYWHLFSIRPSDLYTIAKDMAEITIASFEYREYILRSVSIAVCLQAYDKRWQIRLTKLMDVELWHYRRYGPSERITIRPSQL